MRIACSDAEVSHEEKRARLVGELIGSRVSTEASRTSLCFCAGRLASDSDHGVSLFLTVDAPASEVP